MATGYLSEALSVRFPQANRPVQGRGHWRTPQRRAVPPVDQ